MLGYFHHVYQHAQDRLDMSVCHTNSMDGSSGRPPGGTSPPPPPGSFRKRFTRRHVTVAHIFVWHSPKCKRSIGRGGLRGGLEWDGGQKGVFKSVVAKAVTSRWKSGWKARIQTGP